MEYKSEIENVAMVATPSVIIQKLLTLDADYMTLNSFLSIDQCNIHYFKWLK